MHNSNGYNIIFFTVHDIASVSSCPQEQMELLTHGGKQHHHSGTNGYEGSNTKRANPH
jgi:hypothetical protein